jgi:hypothetical protein
MERRFPQFGLLLTLLMGLLAQSASAQKGERMREWQARQEARREAAAKGHPNERAMEGLPGKWVEKLHNMSPEEQQRFLENNEEFNHLPPARQEQIRNNLERWNRLTPEQRQQAEESWKALERMTPEQRSYVRNTLWPKWQALPQPRRQIINQHLAMLRNMSPTTQQAALSDPKFVAGLSPDEQSMLRELNSLRSPPPTTEPSPEQ